jgi:large exoprotein involved in heme utilization and adhesion
VVLKVADVTLTTNGDINVSAELTQGRDPATSTGNAGTVRILQANSLSINQGGHILLQTETDGTGGFLLANAETIEISGGGFITGTAFGNGDAGSIVLTGQQIILDGGSIASDTVAEGIGGDVTLDAERLTLRGGAQVSTSAQGNADGGSVTLIASDALAVLDSEINTRSEKAGGGNVDIQVIKTIRLDGSIVTATANGQLIDSDGGNIIIDPELFTMRESVISANAVVGAGGNITLVAKNLLVDTQSTITATSQRGVDGTVEIESPNQAVNPVTVSLSTGFQNLPEFLSSDCTAPVLLNRSYLVIENLNPVKSDPADYLHVRVPGPGDEGSGVNMDLLRELVYQPPC